jgi:predicted hotdog family 3-hydroxylacyl-ACP dehydratase
VSNELTEHLPHRGPARFITAVVSADATCATCRAEIPARSPYRLADADGARVPSFLAIEMGAQAAAVLVAAAAPGDAAHTASPGMLVSVRNAEFSAETLPASASFRVVVRPGRNAPPLMGFGFEVWHAAERVAHGELTLLVPA